MLDRRGAILGGTLSSLGDVAVVRVELVGEVRMGGSEEGVRDGEGAALDDAAPPRKPHPLLLSRSLPFPFVSTIVVAELAVVVRLPRPTEKTRASPEV